MIPRCEQWFAGFPVPPDAFCPPLRFADTIPGMTRLLLAALLSSAACTYVESDPHVVVSSTPPGAEILLDGANTGRTTPSKLDLGGFTGSDHAITLRKPGFHEVTRRVYHYRTTSMARWIDGATEPTIWPLPLWWTMGDMLLPFTAEWRYVPHELHAQLYRQDAPAPVSESAAR